MRKLIIIAALAIACIVPSLALAGEMKYVLLIHSRTGAGVALSQQEYGSLTLCNLAAARFLDTIPDSWPVKQTYTTICLPSGKY